MRRLCVLPFIVLALACLGWWERRGIVVERRQRTNGMMAVCFAPSHSRASVVSPVHATTTHSHLTMQQWQQQASSLATHNLYRAAANCCFFNRRRSHSRGRPRRMLSRRWWCRGGWAASRETSKPKNWGPGRQTTDGRSLFFRTEPTSASC